MNQDSHIIISNLVTNPRLKIKQFQEEFFPFSIGVDGFFNKLSSSSLQTTSNVFPPYNIVKEGNKSYIAIALAGYKKSNIEVSVDDGVLLIKGKKGLQETLDDGEGGKVQARYSYRGIANRNFVRKFSLGEHVEVNSAEFTDGMLMIELEEVLPPEKKPKQINIK